MDSVINAASQSIFNAFDIALTAQSPTDLPQGLGLYLTHATVAHLPFVQNFSNKKALGQ